MYLVFINSSLSLIKNVTLSILLGLSLLINAILKLASQTVLPRASHFHLALSCAGATYTVLGQRWGVIRDHFQINFVLIQLFIDRSSYQHWFWWGLITVLVTSDYYFKPSYTMWYLWARTFSFEMSTRAVLSQAHVSKGCYRERAVVVVVVVGGLPLRPLF